MNINTSHVVFIKGEDYMKNPLQKYYRQPAIYIKLPSGGKFNPEFDQTVLDEVPVLPMTAIDEITLKNPDSLLNGESMINVIKSCVPAIPDPSKICNIDAEALFLAIQYATYGQEITHTHECKSCKEKSDFNVDINYMLNKFPSIENVEPVRWGEVEVHIKPPTITAMTRISLIELEQKKIMRTMKDGIDNLDNENEFAENQLAQRFYNSFKKIASHNVSLLANTIGKVVTPEGEVTDSDAIDDFLKNIPTKIVDEINKQVKVISERPKGVSEFEFVCPECGEKDRVELEVNPVNFFAVGS